MTRQRLFPEPTTSAASDEPNQRFDALAEKVLAVSKDEIEKREREWKRAKRTAKKRFKSK